MVLAGQRKKSNQQKALKETMLKKSPSKRPVAARMCCGWIDSNCRMLVVARLPINRFMLFSKCWDDLSTVMVDDIVHLGTQWVFASNDW